MKLIIHIYAIIICFILSLVAITLLVIAFPFGIIGEVITFIKEAISEDEFEHGSWVKLCRECFNYIKGVYNIILDNSL